MAPTHEAKHRHSQERHGWLASRRDAAFDPVAGLANALLLQWVKAKNRLLRRLALPGEVSVFAVAPKPA